MRLRASAGVWLWAAWIALSVQAGAQVTRYDAATLDPTRSAGSMRLERDTHTPLAEQYIWAKDDAAQARADGGWTEDRKEPAAPRYFRKSFTIGSVPAAATLYIAGPRSVRVFVNGTLVGTDGLNLDEQLGMRTFAVDVAKALRPGANLLAIEAERGASKGFEASTRESFQQRHGKVLVAKLVPAAQGVNAKPLLISDGSWKSATQAPQGWEAAAYDDRSWSAADALGGIESSIEFFQANVDGGLYDWPGYDGISPFLAQYALRAVSVGHVFGGRGSIDGAQTLQTARPVDVHVELPAASVPVPQAPQVVLDFGREVVGRLKIASSSAEASDVVVQYGESQAELLRGPYLGQDPVHVPAGASAYGPKSAFRYALVRFTGGRSTHYNAIELAGIAYPVAWKGSFESSDENLNKMWALGAYTAHLCMQDDIWDAPKRDRARWMGDLDVSGRTINDTFGDSFLMEDTLNALLGPAPVRGHVNQIAGYSAFWFTGEAEYYRTHEARAQLASVHTRMVQLLHLMQAELDEQTLFADRSGNWPFVDWSPDLHANTAEARRATQMEFHAAFAEAAYLLRELGDTTEAAYAAKQAGLLRQAAQQHLRDASGAFGDRWQTNAYAVLSGVADTDQYAAIWAHSLSGVGTTKYSTLIVTPYYNYYVVSAMARMDHRQQALDWIRQYWGGMLEEGATSFWEGYDPAWYRDDFHASLEADEMSGYRVSLAHGWSSGVTPWLMEQVLGIHSTAAAFHEVAIRPDLIDLRFAKGAEPTPRGLLGVAIEHAGAHGVSVEIDLPPATVAHVAMPVSPGGQVSLNGKSVKGTAAEEGTRMVVELGQAGHYRLQSE